MIHAVTKQPILVKCSRLDCKKVACRNKYQHDGCRHYERGGLRMRIKSLSIKNFKGIKSLSINADHKDVNIYGDNATGKTTIFDAFTWLLFDKDSRNTKDFGIKPID
ncbi:MAG TPA: ATP-binding protein, partial [Candidatus Nitrosocosmicus sp.]|nr:ATP-binding protein [Candidatus Nitrosocosmicus sp.]